MADFAFALVKALIELLGASALGRLVIQPLIFIVWFSLFGFGYIWMREGNIAEAWRLVLPDTKIEMLHREAELRAIILQVEIKATARSEASIKTTLETLLTHAPGVARIRLGVIHNGTVAANGSGLLKFDVTNAVASNGRTAGDLVQNQPMTGWTRALPDLLGGRCHYATTASQDYAAGRERLMRMGTIAVLTCPVMTVTGQFLGALFLQFDDLREVPVDKAREEMESVAKDAGRSIATALDLRKP